MKGRSAGTSGEKKKMQKRKREWKSRPVAGRESVREVEETAGGVPGGQGPLESRVGM